MGIMLADVLKRYVNSDVFSTQALVANGAKVYITGRRAEALDKVVEQYNTGPGKIVA